MVKVLRNPKMQLLVKPDELIKALDESVEIDNAAKEATVLKGARQAFEKAEYRKYINKLKKLELSHYQKHNFLNVIKVGKD